MVHLLDSLLSEKNTGAPGVHPSDMTHGNRTKKVMDDH